ncbi:hypothetical protein AX774_g2484 [Zancudomyces culisetae]|uniref:Uncharacterized protein n=1 Tax=Zancudomyces culisetae TaxID=1213189 RepID=A0A1R1PSS7_ZANCU|nr:hypothetical protein AX774_g2484 [Zancudomyces culisetae]|eukprot:OMH84001.1 hypothetical protein AX774_g2484 [Zancudomyces culisetae]
MDNEDDAHLFHGLIQLKNKSNTNESVLDTTEDEEDEKEKYSIFAEPKSKKVISLDQIQYEPKSEVDNVIYSFIHLFIFDWIPIIYAKLFFVLRNSTFPI